MNFNLAYHNLSTAAEHARERAKRYEALAVIVKAMAEPGEKETPIIELAKALQELDLCIVHRRIVMQAADVVRETDDHDGLSSSELDDLLRRLEQSLNVAGSAT